MVATAVTMVLGAFDRQRISWELGPASVGYFNPTDKYESGCVLVCSAVWWALTRARLCSVTPPHPPLTHRFGNAFAVLVLVACAAVAFVLHPASRAKAKEHDEPASAPYTAMNPHA